MQHLHHVNDRLLASLTLSVRAIVLAVAFGSPEWSDAGLTVQAFQSPIETPTPPPPPSTQDVDLQIVCIQPDRLRQSVPVTISVIARADIEHLRIHLFAGSPHAVLAGPHTRVVEMRAGETLVFTNDVRLLREGIFNFVAQAFGKQGQLAFTSCNMMLGQPGDIFPHPNRPPEAEGSDQPIEKLSRGGLIPPQPTPSRTPDPFVLPLPNTHVCTIAHR